MQSDNTIFACRLEACTKISIHCSLDGCRHVQSVRCTVLGAVHCLFLAQLSLRSNCTVRPTPCTVQLFILYSDVRVRQCRCIKFDIHKLYSMMHLVPVTTRDTYTSCPHCHPIQLGSDAPHQLSSPVSVSSPCRVT